MMEAGFTPADEAEASEGVKPDYSVELMNEYIMEKISAMESAVIMRGPYLAQLQLLKMLTEKKKDDLVPIVGEWFQ